MKRQEVEEICIMMSFITVFFAKCNQSYHVEEDEMGNNGEKRNAYSLFMGK
jgi:hypothetical protein